MIRSSAYPKSVLALLQSSGRGHRKRQLFATLTSEPLSHDLLLPRTAEIQRRFRRVSGSTVEIIMGCCFSRADGPNAPYPGGAPSGSAHPINSPRPQASATEESALRSPPVTESNRPLPQSSPQGSHRRRAQEPPPLAQHIDKPLRRHVWFCDSRAWTKDQLAKERAEFFDTRVTGREEVWQTLQAALGVLWEEKSAQDASVTTAEGDFDSETALATAQSILKAAEITLPTGDLANGVYDSLGHYYALPEFVVTDPVNVAEDKEQQTDGMGKDVGKAEEDLNGGEHTAEEVVDDGEARFRREEKGKAVADERAMIKIRARLSDTGRDVIVKAGNIESVRSVARKIHEEAGLNASRWVRLAYMGKILKENSTLEVQGYKQGHVVNALVFTQ
ncbi:hypothetical protein BJ170DRAFT_597425 [Xylariales sp. AK1849]|nr:hypothetical protein BJ170DRAFT_597425 [Xylariales sp. AK1849]